MARTFRRVYDMPEFKGESTLVTTNRRSRPDPAEILRLVRLLGQKNGLARRRAREALQSIGPPATPFLIPLLSDRKEHTRWEAAKALTAIRDPEATQPLIKALMDESFEVAWTAAEALAALGRTVLVPLLRASIEHFNASTFRRGARQVLHALDGKGLLDPPLERYLEALRSSATAEFSVLAAADEALSYMEKRRAPAR